MPFQVLGGPTKDSEYEQYIEALSELGLPTERDGSGRVGVVADEPIAQQILKKLRQKVKWIPWQIVEISVQNDA